MRIISKLLVLLLLTTSCQENLPSLEKKEKLPVAGFTSLHKESDLFQALNHAGLFEKNNQSGRLMSGITEFKADSIFKVIQADSINYTYTLFLHESVSRYTFKNLVLSSYSNGFLAYVLEYVSDKPLNSFESFTGIVKKYDLEGRLLDETSINNSRNPSDGSRTKACFAEVEMVCVSGGEISTATGLPLPCLQWEMLITIECEGGSGGSGGSTGGWYSLGTYIPYPYDGYGGGGGGSGSGGGPTGDDPNFEGGIGVLPPTPEFLRSQNFISELSVNAQAFMQQNVSVASSIYNYLESHISTTGESYQTNAVVFVKELIDLALEENDNVLSEKLINIALITESQEYFTRALDGIYYSQIDSYVDLDLTNADIQDQLTTYLTVKYQILKTLHSDWPESELLWETAKDVVHIGLDLFGLVPVLGEAADLINGVIYTIEGDGFNASLSYAGAIPIVGWVGPTTRHGLKIINSASELHSKVKLVWSVTPEGVIKFGSSNSFCRQQLRKTLGLIVGDARQAHHIIPLNKQIHPVIQKAAKSGNAFHMNEALNGIPLNTVVHNGSHGNYDDLIQNYLDAVSKRATPEQAYNEVIILINRIRTAIQASPNTPINELIF